MNRFGVYLLLSNLFNIYCQSSNSLSSHLSENLKSKLITDGLISIYSDDYYETFVYENKVEILKGEFQNESIVCYYIDKINEKIISSNLFDDKIYLFTKFRKNHEHCMIHIIKDWKIQKTDYLVSKLCDYLNNAILIKFENKNELKFYYSDSIIKYSMLNHEVEKYYSGLFQNLPMNYLYKKFYSSYIVYFIYEDKTIEYNYKTLKLLQVSNFEANSILNNKANNPNYGTLIAASSISSLFTLLVVILIMFLKSKYFVNLTNETKDGVNEIQEILVKSVSEPLPLE